MGAVSFVFQILDRISGPGDKMARALTGVSRSVRDSDKAISALDKQMGQLDRAMKIKELGAITDPLKRQRAELELNKMQLLAHKKGLEEDAEKSKGLSRALNLGAGAATVAAQAFAALAVAGAGLAVAGASYATEMAAFRESAQVGFGFALGGAEKASTTWRYAQGIANTLGTSVRGVAGNLKALFKQGFGARESEMITQMLADLKVMSGGDEQNPAVIGDAIMALKKNQSLSVDMFKPLTEIGPAERATVFNTLAAKLGLKGKDDKARERVVTAALNTGQVRGQKAMDLYSDTFLKATGKSKVGDVAKGFQDTTITGSIDKIKARVENLFASINSKGAGSKLVGILQRVAEALNPASEGGAKLLATLDRASAAAERLLGRLNVGMAVDSFADLVDAIDDMLGPIEAFAGGFTDGFTEVFGVTREMIDRWGGGASTAETFAAALKMVGTALGYIAAGAVVGIGGLIYIEAKLAGMAAWALGAGTSIGLAIIDGLSGGIDSAKGKLIERLNALGGLLPESLRKVLEIHSPSKVFAEIGANVSLGLAQGVEDEAPAAREATLSVLSPRLVAFGSASAQGGIAPAPSQAAVAQGSGGRGPAQVTLVQHIDGAQNVEAVRKAAEEGALAAIARMFEGVALEAGVVGPSP